ncbi:rod shape-determining protein MreC [uncultured Alistipes sp.]|uniref:rod shape-determining protein MreC n=1 Tax=uncultured Alistipes sp. TaxID=538949 RepID=UPI0025CCCA6C|nr:rod shape-determining protein MreC [uncultured Alistipes sp.]
MRKLLEFIRSTYVVVLFVVLEAIAIGYYARSTHYTQARLLTRSNQVVGGLHSMSAGIRRYFSLGRENRDLIKHVAELKERLAMYEEAETAARLDEYMQALGASKYRFIAAAVTSNTINRAQNFIILNRGSDKDVVEEMAVLASDGSMAGYVVACSSRYAVAMSVLNTSFRASGKLENADYFGSVYWDGVDPHTVVLDELSKYADPQPGQKVVTAGFSQYFPPDVLIGWVESAELNETRTAYKVRVRLAAEMSALNSVILVENRDQTDIRDLMNSEKIEQHIRPN